MPWLKLEDTREWRNEFVRNLQIAYYNATCKEFDEGHNWYERTSSLLKREAKAAEVDLTIYTAIVAATSPSVSWAKNVQVANEVIKGENSSVTAPTFEKCRRILHYEIDVFNAFSRTSAAKTYNFFFNLLDPKDPGFVTIDRHAIRACLGQSRMMGYRGPIGINCKTYDILAESYFELASHYGVLANQIQAVVWLYSKRVYGQKRTAQ